MKKKPELKPYVMLIFESQRNILEDESHAIKLVNAQRGFPNGFPLKKYKCEDDCEKACPGIGDAQLTANWSTRIKLDARVYIDKDGKGRYEIIKPSGLDIKVVDK